MYSNTNLEQQPMSMVTIDANLGRSTNSMATGNNMKDLLTLRILEASEKKMRLIKKLLTPEEYELVVSSLLDKGSEFATNRKLDDNRDTSSMPPQFKLKENGETLSAEMQVDNGATNFSQDIRSDRSIRVSASNLQETIANRKEAQEFFFPSSEDMVSPTTQPKDMEASLAMELRSGYQFYGLFESREGDEQVVRESSFLADLVEKFWGLMGFLGLESDIKDDDKINDDFVRNHKGLNCHPYSRKRNLIKFIDRLAKDKQPDLAIQTSFFGCKSKETIGGQQTNFQILRNERENFVSPMVQSTFGPFNKIQLMRAKSMSDLMRISEDQFEVLLQYHPLICCLSGKEQFESKHHTASSNVVDKLYSIIYGLQPTIFESREAKLSRLMNNVDPQFLLTLLGGSQTLGSTRFFALNPFECKLIDGDSMFPNEDSDRPKQVRAAMLAWRWVNNLTRLTVHLSERENYKLCQRKSASDARGKIKEAMSSIKRQLHLDTSQPHLYIERIRLRAIEFVKNLELHVIGQLQNQQRPHVALSGDSSTVPRHQQVVALKDLLREPRIKFQFSGVARAAKRLTPHKTARRPLMPKRKRFNSNLRSRAKLDAIETGAVKGDLEASLRDQVNSETQWSQLPKTNQLLAGSDIVLPALLSADRIINNLRLVVTVQQASNVPLRMHQQQQQQVLGFNGGGNAGGRPISPSFFQRPLTPTTMTNVILLPPTTYVEVVFQRQQQTSSLVQGKNPTWNETLFFPVAQSSSINSQVFSSESLESGDEGDRANDGTTIQSKRQVETQSQNLIDECLQINLYDYNCYTIQDSSQLQQQQQQQQQQSLSLQQQDFSTLAMSSIEPTTLLSTEAERLIRASRLVTSNQRIERHLLGSLRVPLSTVLTNGRIEGSFALNQPLLLENYQFEPEMMQQNPPSLLKQQLQPAQQQTVINKRQETYVSLFITLDPPVSMPMSFYLPLNSYEDEQVVEYVRLWEQILIRGRSSIRNQGSTMLSLRSPNLSSNKRQQSAQLRHIRALALQSNAKYCIITRLLFALQPPSDLIESIEGNDDNGSNRNLTQFEQMRAVARFVSLLSPLKYGLMDMRSLAPSLWFNSAQLINRYLGGAEEKAVLLCNYFLYMGKCSALLLGDSLPDGRCVYVIVWQEQPSRFVESQLQLQVGDLIESISGIRPPVAGLSGETINDNLNYSDFLTGANRVDRLNFISRLPILINYKTIQLWDPTSGKSYSLRRDQLPLISVGSMVTPENVYANLQNVNITGSISELNFDIRLRNCWFPLFESTSATTTSNLANSTNKQNISRLPIPKNLAQMSFRKQLIYLESRRKLLTGSVNLNSLLDSTAIQLNYRKFSREEANRLRETIEKAIKTNLLNWRPGRPTYFNRTLSRLLAEKLTNIERRIYRCERVNEQTITQEIDYNEFDWRSELATTIREDILAAHLAVGSTSASAINPTGSSRQVISWPVNVPFTSIRSILDSLYASGVHDADLSLMANPSQPPPTTTPSKGTTQNSRTLGTQFLVACHVEPFPARVMSVWLYVAAIVNGNNGIGYDIPNDLNNMSISRNLLASPGLS